MVLKKCSMWVNGKALGATFHTGFWTRQQLWSRIAMGSVVGRFIGSGSNSSYATCQQSDFGQVILHLSTSVCSYVK